MSLFTFSAKSCACLRSSASGLPLFSPPKSLRKLFVLKPAQLNSSIIVYPLDCNFSLSNKWFCATNSLSRFPSYKATGAPNVEKRKAFLPFASGSVSTRSRREVWCFAAYIPEPKPIRLYSRSSSGLICCGVFIYASRTFAMT